MNHHGDAGFFMLFYFTSETIVRKMLRIQLHRTDIFTLSEDCVCWFMNSLLVMRRTTIYDWRPACHVRMNMFITFRLKIDSQRWIEYLTLVYGPRNVYLSWACHRNCATYQFKYNWQRWMLFIEYPIEVFSSLILEATEESVPKASPHVRTVRMPWCNEDCRQAIRRRRRALKQFSTSPNSAGLSDVRVTWAKTGTDSAGEQTRKLAAVRNEAE